MAQGPLDAVRKSWSSSPPQRPNQQQQHQQQQQQEHLTTMAIFGGKPSKGTKADKRLKTNKGK